MPNYDESQEDQEDSQSEELSNSEEEGKLHYIGGDADQLSSLSINQQRNLFPANQFGGIALEYGQEEANE